MKRDNKVIEQYRFAGPVGQNNGAFKVKFESYELRIIASDGMSWDHVSVSLPNRCPNWKEMSFVKDLFFDEDETVAQFHPKKSEYVNYHPYCLHLWRKQDEEFLLPPSIFVGPSSAIQHQTLGENI